MSINHITESDRQREALAAVAEGQVGFVKPVHHDREGRL